MSLDYIPNHTELALSRLLIQYQDKPRIRALLSALVNPIQGLEDGYQTLITGRTIYDAIGIQLDKLGVIVGQPRNGLTDEPYRIRLQVRIIQNISQGEPDLLIQVYQFLTNNDAVQIEEVFPAGIRLSTRGDIAESDVTDIYKNIQEIAGAGIRVNSIATVNSEVPFCFAGGVRHGNGFGDKNNPGNGGPMSAKRVPVGIRFAFTGGSNNNRGFGDRRDPVMGGHMIGV